jgi:DNA-binding LytR/AlgR family response regulator
MNERNDFIKDRGVIVPIDYNDIISVDVDAYLCTVYFEKGDTMYLVRSLNEMLALLPADSFAQITRNIIVNVNRITKFEGAKLLLSSGKEYLVSRRRMGPLKQTLVPKVSLPLSA